MTKYLRETLSNGLTLLVAEDSKSSMAAINVLYKVGSKDELESSSGLAHLFEHLMFSGTKEVTDFDHELQLAGGDSNAFTNQDITNYYCKLPAENIETAIWLEANRMGHLNIEQEVFDNEKRVVAEEYKETCLNRPYGLSWHHISEMAYKQHTYKWPTIGKNIEAIEALTLQTMRDFGSTYYAPNNAVVSIVGNIDAHEAMRSLKIHFGQVEKGKNALFKVKPEPDQTEMASKVIRGNYPLDVFYLCFHMSSRMDAGYYVADLLSDVLGNGKSSRLYNKLVLDKKWLVSVDAYVTGTTDCGLLVIEGKAGIDGNIEKAEIAVWQELELLTKQGPSEKELQKCKNKVESNMIFSEISIMTRSLSLAYYEYLGDATLINSEMANYLSVTKDEIKQSAKKIFKRSNCTHLECRKK